MIETLSGKVEMLKGEKGYSYQAKKSVFLNAYVFDSTLDNSLAGTKMREQIKQDIVENMDTLPNIDSLITGFFEAIQNAYKHKENEPYPNIYATLIINDKKELIVDVISSGKVKNIDEYSKNIKQIKSKMDLYPYLVQKHQNKDHGGLGLYLISLTMDVFQYSNVKNVTDFSMTKFDVSKN